MKALSRSENDATATRGGKSLRTNGQTEEEVVRSEDILFKQNYPEETEAPSQVWREKITIHEEEAPPEAPTPPHNESQDN